MQDLRFRIRVRVFGVQALASNSVVCRTRGCFGVRVEGLGFGDRAEGVEVVFLFRV